jgi:hypothetical protein
VYKLRVACAERYPELIRQCELAMAQVLPNKVGRTRKTNERCLEVYSFSKHWPCLFPQHGPGRKHERKIELVPWQQELVDLDPRPLVRGLLHSDGCRVLNWVNGTAYPRYHFSNVSADIRGIFGRACDQLGIEWRPNNPFSLSVARRGSVALLDEFVGPSGDRGRERPVRATLLLAEAVGGLQELLGGQVGTDDLNVHTGPFDPVSAITQ